MNEATREESREERAAAPLPVRIEIAWTLPPGTVWDLLALPLFVANAGMLMRSGDPYIVVLAPALICIFVVALILRFVIYGGARPYSRLGVTQTVLLEGMLLEIERRTRKGHESRVFPILELHDLRVLPAPVGPNPILRHERLGFTYHRKAYSFGGLADDATAARVLADIVDYDARLRASLGMDAEPNIGTLEKERILGATARGYDTE